jgi:hypothetical protein
MTDIAQIPVVAGGTTYQITGANLSSYFGGSEYGNANVVANLAALGTNPVSTTGNITGGNISTGIITLTNGAVIKDNAGDSVAFGQSAGGTSQGNSSVALGHNAGATGQGTFAVAVGRNAGQNTQGGGTVAVGVSAGGETQGNNAIAIGSSAGFTGQGTYAVGVGIGAGQTNQGVDAVAVGNSAGSFAQGIAAVAIGTLAGRTSQGNNSIIINATGANLDQTTANTFTVAPVRNDVANIGQVVFYNTTSKEITYGNVISVAGNVTGGNVTTGGLISATGNITGGNINTGSRVVTTPVAFSTLTAVTGARAFVNDGNLVASGNFGAQVSDGGANTVPVWSNGANWYIG